jgi:hypothetical protein
LADAQASGACGSNIVWVQVPSPALHRKDIGMKPMSFFVQEMGPEPTTKN